LAIAGRIVPKTNFYKMSDNSSITSHDIFISYSKQDSACKAEYFREYFAHRFGLKAMLSRDGSYIRNMHDVCYTATALLVILEPKQKEILFRFDILSEILVAYVFQKEIVFLKSEEEDMHFDPEFFSAIQSKLTPAQTALLTGYRLDVKRDGPAIYKELLLGRPATIAIRRLKSRASANANASQSMPGAGQEAGDGDAEKPTDPKQRQSESGFKSDKAAHEIVTVSIGDGNENLENVQKLIDYLDVPPRRKSERAADRDIGKEAKCNICMIGDIWNSEVASALYLLHLKLGGKKSVTVIKDPDTQKIEEFDVCIFCITQDIFTNKEIMTTMYKNFGSLPDQESDGIRNVSGTSLVCVTLDLLNYDNLIFDEKDMRVSMKRSSQTYEDAEMTKAMEASQSKAGTNQSQNEQRESAKVQQELHGVVKTLRCCPKIPFIVMGQHGRIEVEDVCFTVLQAASQRTGGAPLKKKKSLANVL
jgi:hypothetical protein